MRLLLVEDDEVIARNIDTLLSKQGYSIDRASSISEGERLAFEQSYDCIILDRTLPDGDSISLIPGIRKETPDTSILLLTAKNRAEDIVKGLNTGADDYLSKPFLPDELLARVRALLRRSTRRGNPTTVTLGTISIDTAAHLVTKEGSPINLSPREYAVLEYLLMHKGEAIDRQELLEHVWGESVDMFSNTVDVHIRFLRKKLDTPGQESFIKTVKGKGYRL